MSAAIGKAIAAAIVELNPLGKAGYERRARNKAYRKARRKQRRGEVLTPEEEMIMSERTATVTLPDGTVVEREEPIINARTSTKSLIGGTFLSQVYVQLVGLLPYPDLVAALTTPEMVALVAVGLAALVARFTKSPLIPTAL